ncbi:hypothetical protein GCM10010174_52020 [Kutzneria viridogrisea]
MVESLANRPQRPVGLADLGRLGFSVGHRALVLIVVRLADQVVMTIGGIRGRCRHLMVSVLCTRHSPSAAPGYWVAPRRLSQTPASLPPVDDAGAGVSGHRVALR